VRLGSQFHTSPDGLILILGTGLVEIVTDEKQETCGLRIVKIIKLSTSHGYDGDIPPPTEGAVFRLGSGRRMWSVVQELKQLARTDKREIVSSQS
jgi:hypothetical protein